MSAGEGVKTREINCTGCGTAMRVHEPGVCRIINTGITQITFFPQWSVDERVCPNCKTVMAPVIGDLKLVWTGIGKTNEDSRIIVPEFVPPKSSVLRAV